jgi:CPA2 family monovalent cation:H+ antiporter-2
VHNIEVLAEIGVILLLFTVGIEFSLKNILRMRRAVLMAGGSQVLITILVAAAIAYPLSKNLNASIFIGFLIALSSTAIVLKTLGERGEIDTTHGRLMLGILIFQDLCVVPFMLLTPSLSGTGIDFALISWTIIKAMLIVAMVLLSARWIVPNLLHLVVHTRSRELFILTVILVCMGTALLTSRFGLSLALGAFIAGLVMSESEYAFEATAEILPFKESFMGLFFISIGMLIDTSYIWANWQKVLAVVAFILVLKALVTTLSTVITSSSARTSLHAAIGLSQIGEFSFILAEEGKAAGLISGATFQLFLSAAVLTMTLTPFLLRAAPRASAWLALRKPMNRLRRVEIEEGFSKGLAGHALIVGFGLNGRNLAYTLKKSDVSYVVLELNSETVMREMKKGEPIFFGDATNAEILRKFGIHRARVLVVVISDPASARKIVHIARNENPSLHIIVRTRYVAEVEDLRALGAAEVIPEEFETSVEIFARVLQHYNVPRNIINDNIDEIRKNEYRALRTHELRRKSFKDMEEMTKGIETETYLVKEGSQIPGHNLRELHLRAMTGATVIAIAREGALTQNPSPDFVMKENDVLLLVGKREHINRAMQYMESDEFLASKYH